MNRFPRIALCITLLLAAAGAKADVREPSIIRLAHESSRPVVSGEAFEGVIEFTPGADGVIECVEIGGDGWEGSAIDRPARQAVRAGQIIRIPFKADALDASSRLRVRISLNGDVIETSFDLSPTAIAAIGKPGRSERVDVPTAPAADDDAGGGAGPRGCDDQQIRVRGHIQYIRTGVDNSIPPNGTFTDGFDSNGDGDYNDPSDVPDLPPAAIGADSIRFYILDEDVFDSELMFDGLTDQQGNFDVTICWDDCDVSGCDDPDIYLVYATDTDVVTVRREDNDNQIWAWSTQESLIFEDYEGGDVNFGIQQPSNTAQFPAIHMHNSMVRAHRYVLENNGYDTPQVDVIWQTPNGAFYRASQEQIFIGPDEQWNEGTQVHEWGHHLLYQWTSPVPPNYCNGICDDASPNVCGGDPCVGGGGHCIWCNETANDAWNEGFPNWLGSVLLRIWAGRYGNPAPLAINDFRYTLETTQACCGGAVHSALTTEGFVGALLRDIEDPPQDPGQSACPQDALGLGGDEILHVVRSYAPIRVIDFISGFRTEYPQRQHDFYATAQSVAAAYIAGWTLPPVFVTAINGCGSYRTGETITLTVEANASQYSSCMRWQRDGAPVTDGGRISGATTETLTIMNAQTTDVGRYTLQITSCDGPAGAACNGTQSTTSPPISVRIIGNSPGHRITGWGRNTFGMLGRGTNQPDSDPNPADVINLTSAVGVSAGYWNSIAVLADGTAWCWGTRYLGNGTSDGSATPVQVNNLTDVVAVAAGSPEGNCMALDVQGHVWTWGSNYQGLLGYSQPGGVALNPGQVDLECVVKISLGNYHVAAITGDGSLWMWGSNAYGELGQGNTGGASQLPVRVTDLSDVIDVDCGGGHTLALRADGTLWACGWNQYGQLGDGTFENRNRFVRVASLANVAGLAGGQLHSVARLSNGEAWAWGSNINHTLGTGASQTNHPSPARVITVGSVRAVDAGYQLSVITAADGTIWTCGSNYAGQLGRPFNGTESGWLPAPVDTRVGAGAIASAGTNFVMTIAPGARIIAPLADQFVAGASTARLSVATVGEPPLNYQWGRRQPDGTFQPLTDTGRFSGTTTPTLNVAQTEIGDSGLYNVRVWNSTNDVTSSQVTLSTPPLLNAFDSPQDGEWFGNERGNWAITNGAYAAATPGIYPPVAYSSFDLPQTDFMVELDVVNASHVNFDTNGGIFLRSDLNLPLPYPRGVVLAWGEAFPWGGGDIYWHFNHGSGYNVAQNIAHSVYSAGQTLHLRIEARGDTFTCWANDAPTPTTTITNANFPAGRIALLDGVASGTAFDNIFIQTLTNCEPGPGTEPVRIFQRPQSQTVPAGTPITLNLTATGTGPLGYQWLRNGQSVSGATQPSFSFTASAATEGRWECTVTNTCGSVGCYPATVTVEGGPPGDMDGDGHVGLQDLSILLSSFGACAGQPAFNPAADIDGDGCVSLQDLATLLANFGA